MTNEIYQYLLTLSTVQFVGIKFDEVICLPKTRIEEEGRLDAV